MLALLAHLLLSQACCNPLCSGNYATPGTGLQSYFVDGSSGNDTNGCMGSGASACATIQGALNKIPKLLRDQVTVNVAPGTYPGFIVSGFMVDNAVQQATGGLLIAGALANSTLASGAATGTATSGTAGSGSTFGTLADGAATWTPNDLVGRFVTTSAPTNTAVLVSSNTATALTVVGTWAAPTGSTTYMIQDPSVILNTGVSRPATPNNASSVRAGILLSSNFLGGRQDSIVIRQMRVANATGPSGVELGSSTGVRLETMQLRPAASNSTGVSTTSLPLVGYVSLFNVDVSLTSGLVGLNFFSGGIVTASKVLARNSVNSGDAFAFRGGTTILSLSAIESRAFVDGIIIDCATGLTSLGVGNFTGNRIACGTSSGVGISVGVLDVDDQNTIGCPSVFGPIDTTDIATCNTAVQTAGSAGVEVSGLTGSVSTTGFDVRNGGLITFVKAGVTLTASTNEVNLDNGALTTTFSSINANSCAATPGFGSRVCGR